MNQRGWAILMTFLAGVLVAAGWFSSRSVESVQVAPAMPIPENVAPPPSSPAPPSSQEEGVPAVVPTVVAAPEPRAVAPPPPSFVPRPEGGTPRPPKHPVDPQESALLAQAKELVKSDPEQALRELTALRQQFPDGALSKDAELVRVEAYLRLGRRQDAEALGQKLIGSDPSTRKAVGRLLERVRPN